MKKIVFAAIFLAIISVSSVLLSIPINNNTEIRSKAAGNTIKVCPDNESGCSFMGGDGIQQAVDNAQNGDIILLQPGRYTRKQPTDDPQIKYRYCLINTRGKTLTIKGQGAILDGENGGINYGLAEDKAIMAIGICDHGGDILIESLQIKQTLRPAIFLRNSKAVIKNVTFLDIDSSAIDVWMDSEVIILNNLFAGSAGPGINVLPLPGKVNVRIENNTFVGNGGAGVVFNLCGASEPSANVTNNLIVNPGDLFSNPLSGSGIGADCRQEEQKLAGIKSSNNFVWKGQSIDGCVKGPDKLSPYANCVPGEICTGTTVTYPYFIGADDEGTVCVWGEGRMAGDFNTRPSSPITQAGAGFGHGPCSNPESSACLNYIESQKSQFTKTIPTDSTPPESIDIIPTQDIYERPPSIIPSDMPYDNTPTKQPQIIPTRPIGSGGNDSGPPITYYLPPTMGIDDSRRTDNEENNSDSIDSTASTIHPSPKPIFDVKKTVENVKTSWDNFVLSIINFTKTILP